jgi:hypothetical protein
LESRESRDGFWGSHELTVKWSLHRQTKLSPRIAGFFPKDSFAIPTDKHKLAKLQSIFAVGKPHRPMDAKLTGGEAGLATLIHQFSRTSGCTVMRCFRADQIIKLISGRNRHETWHADGVNGGISINAMEGFTHCRHHHPGRHQSLQTACVWRMRETGGQRIISLKSSNHRKGEIR